MEDYIGKHIDRYLVTERLGQGGMAVVYKAYDTHLDRDVAIKVIRSEAISPEQYTRRKTHFRSHFILKKPFPFVNNIF
jgi:eukaryotic-like serine/threonine-protein kinase